jgi:hypothetical protein
LFGLNQENFRSSQEEAVLGHYTITSGYVRFLCLATESKKSSEPRQAQETEIGIIGCISRNRLSNVFDREFKPPLRAF